MTTKRLGFSTIPSQKKLKGEQHPIRWKTHNIQNVKTRKKNAENQLNESCEIKNVLDKTIA